MRDVTCFCLTALAVSWSFVQAAPAPAPKYASPAVIDAGCEENMVGVLEDVVDYARVGVRENEKVAGLDIVRRQKDWEAWLRKNLRVERVKGTKHVRVGFRDGNREEQAAIVNTVVDYYLTKIVQGLRERDRHTLKKLRGGFEASRGLGKLTPEQVKKGEAVLKKREERLQQLPTLVEHANAR